MTSHVSGQGSGAVSEYGATPPGNGSVDDVTADQPLPQGNKGVSDHVLKCVDRRLAKSNVHQAESKAPERIGPAAGIA